MAKATNCVKNGIKYYRITASIGTRPDGSALKKEFYGRSKNEAESKRDAYLSSIRSGLVLEYKSKPLWWQMEKWLFDIVSDKKANGTFLRYECDYRLRIKNADFAALTPSEVSTMVLKKHYEKMLSNGESRTTVIRVNKVLGSFYTWARGEGLALINPTQRAVPQKNTSEAHIELHGNNGSDVKPFEDWEIPKIRAACRGYFNALFDLGLGSGLRMGELTAVSEEDFDFERCTVIVKRQTKRMGTLNKATGKIAYTLTLSKKLKTKNSCREAPFPSSIVSVIKEQIQAQNDKCKKLGIKYEKSMPIFTTETGELIDGTNLNHAWGRVLKRAGVDYRKFHNIRHTFATKLFEQEIDIETIALLLGDTVETTRDTYVHIMPKKREISVAKLDYLYDLV